MRLALGSLTAPVLDTLAGGVSFIQESSVQIRKEEGSRGKSPEARYLGFRSHSRIGCLPVGGCGGDSASPSCVCRRPPRGNGADQQRHGVREPKRGAE